MARRHQRLVAGAAGLLVAAVCGLAVGAVLINRERVRAEESFRQARAAVDDYFTTVSENELLDVPGANRRSVQRSAGFQGYKHTFNGTN